MNAYQREQRDTYRMIAEHLTQWSDYQRRRVLRRMDPYLRFRQETGDFLSRHFAGVCNRQCYESRLSACCTRDGIVTFFADMVVDQLVTPPQQVAERLRHLQRVHEGPKCLYLGPGGCRWRLKPIVCEMFLCDKAKALVFGENTETARAWEELEKRRKAFTWPDRPVLFDDLERIFLQGGCVSPLMYLHNSPGLMRIKRTWNSERMCENEG